MGFFNTMNISASGLSAQRTRMDTISQNMANINTTRAADGGPVRRRVVVFEERVEQPRTFGDVFARAAGQLPGGLGVRVHSVIEDESPGQMVWDPGHPDADADGYVHFPNINPVVEMVNMISASRSYEANITMINITQAMINRTLEISSR